MANNLQKRKRDWHQRGGDATTIKLDRMEKHRDLLAELRRHDLLKPLVQRQIIADAIRDEQLRDELEEARKVHAEQVYKDKEALDVHLAIRA